MAEKSHLPTLAPRNFEDAVKFSELLAHSNFVPTVFKGKPGDILAAIQMGYEVGLSPMAALQNIAVINGRPSMWGDALLALVQASGLLESIEETDDGQTATCTVKRKGDPVPRVAKFSMENARQAGLVGKGVWQQYPARMRQMRARNFALRDKFADVLKGLIAREEAIDVTPPAEGAPPLHLQHEPPPDDLPQGQGPGKYEAANAAMETEAKADIYGGIAMGTQDDNAADAAEETETEGDGVHSSRLLNQVECDDLRKSFFAANPGCDDRFLAMFLWHAFHVRELTALHVNQIGEFAAKSRELEG